MASTSASEKPLAMRSMTVEGRAPERNACIAATISTGLRPARDGMAAIANLRSTGWQPEQALAPDGGSVEAAIPDPISTSISAAAKIARVAFMAAAPALE